MPTVSGTGKRVEIEHALELIEKENDLKVLYACEAGSRAWEFASDDSDYDVRFIYIRPPSWYLSINIANKADVIEKREGKILDIVGWDLPKALRLYRKSNPPLLEWIGSPIAYVDTGLVIPVLNSLIPRYYDRQSCFYHYLGMSKRNYKAYIQGRDEVKMKKYLYVLRPIVAINFIETHNRFPPTSFIDTLRQVKGMPPFIRSKIEGYIYAKRMVGELGTGVGDSEMNEWIESEYTRLEGVSFDKKDRRDLKELNKLFRDCLKKVYST